MKLALVAFLFGSLICTIRCKLVTPTEFELTRDLLNEDTTNTNLGLLRERVGPVSEK